MAESIAADAGTINEIHFLREPGAVAAVAASNVGVFTESIQQCAGYLEAIVESMSLAFLLPLRFM